MQSLSSLDPDMWGVQIAAEKKAYTQGSACGFLWKSDKTAAVDYHFSGQLYLSKSGWLLLSVPNSLVQGVFDALQIPGAELPLAGAMNVPNVEPGTLNAHISVMTPDEVNKIGASKITERGKTFRYSLGRLQEYAARKIDGVSRLWSLRIASPALTALRKSYGLDPKPAAHGFAIMVAVRRKGVLQDNRVAKGRKAASELSRSGQKDLLPGGAADNIPAREFSSDALAEGVKHEREHTEKDQVAKEIAKDHLQEDPAYYEKVKKLEGADKKADLLDSAYARSLQKNLNVPAVLQYNPRQTVGENLVGYLQRVKNQGDFKLQADQNYQKYLAAANPKYRDQLAQKAIRGELKKPSYLDQAVSRYGDSVLASLRGG